MVITILIDRKTESVINTEEHAMPAPESTLTGHNAVRTIIRKNDVYNNVSRSWSTGDKNKPRANYARDRDYTPETRCLEGALVHLHKNPFRDVKDSQTEVHVYANVS